MLYEFTELLVLFDVESKYFIQLSELKNKIKTLDFLKKYNYPCSYRLQDFNHIEYVYFEWKKIVNISPLSIMINLKKLDLIKNNIKYIKPLAKLTNLENLYLNNNNIKYIKPLAKLINLKILQLSGNKIVDIKPLSKLTNLKKLYLCYNHIVDIRPLQHIKLQELIIHHNEIVNIPFLSTTLLESLDLTFNNICYIDPNLLKHMKNLKTLDLENNYIKYDNFIELKKTLSFCRLEY